MIKLRQLLAVALLLTPSLDAFGFDRVELVYETYGSRLARELVGCTNFPDHILPQKMIVTGSTVKSLGGGRFRITTTLEPIGVKQERGQYRIPTWILVASKKWRRGVAEVIEDRWEWDDVKLIPRKITAAKTE